MNIYLNIYEYFVDYPHFKSKLETSKDDPALKMDKQLLYLSGSLRELSFYKNVS